ncbi:MFS transporter [Parathalassolituus penaei]|uniref:MFS transporter n=1 Tax=Parathalassolituus penaei TaxID=2997323 RepID=A0A9X3EGC8_9GAMM|nr:MFS transporter [Parathalassolituus penaei]MCY0966235.1 MFS transporter [Parathalassolituus penaei]
MSATTTIDAGRPSEAASPTLISDRKLYKLVIASSIGNALEWFDLIVYAFFAATISKLFFPSENETVSLMMTLGAFALSYLIRPLGALVLGSYADRKGRKAAMLVSLWLMMAGTAMIAVMPTWETAGLLAPLGIFAARLLQGFSAGGEFGSATALLVERAPDKKGLISSFMFASQGVSGLLGSGFGLLLTTTLTTQQLEDWGWRIPFLFGLLIGPIGLYIRKHIEESAEFNHHATPESTPIAELFRHHKGSILLAIGALMLSTSVSYTIIYMPTYAVKQLGLQASTGFAGTLLSGLILTLLTPFVGHFSDRLGRTRIMIWAASIFVITILPVFYFLGLYPALGTLFVMLTWLSLLKALYFGGLPALMSDLFETRVRASGLALSYNIGTTLFGSAGPLLITWMLSATGSGLAPAYYLGFTSVVSLVTLFLIRKHRKIG